MSVLAREPARPAQLRTWPHAWLLAVGTVCFGAFMGQLDASIVTLTYGPLGAEFGASLAGVQWVSLSYLLTLTALLVPIGRLSDAHGRKLLYLYGFVVFTVASAACVLAPTLGWLIAFRVVQGVGAAMLQANSVALISTCAPPGRRRAALGIQAAAQALGLALGPTVGGLLVSTLGWRWVFGINVPIGVVAVVAGVFLLPRTRHRSSTTTWDVTGLLLLVTATTAGLLGLTALSGLTLPGWVAPALFVVTAAAVLGIVTHSRRFAAPLLDPALLRSRAVAAGLGGAVGGYLILFGPLVLVPVVLVAAGESELHAGLVLTALPAGFALAATTGERLLPAAWSDRLRCLVGALAVVCATGLLVVVPLTPAWLVPMLGILGLALGIFTPANNSLVMGLVPARTAGTGGGLVNMARSLGTALGVALVTLTLHTGTAESAARTALAALAAVAVALVVSAWLVPVRRPDRGPGCWRPRSARRGGC
ncbi:MFS transporter [Pseudonocardia xinjiangensis]|uniref:MFS transporter n=1 Tax=Pseudonocardia xinjiangensis TaxID=75289 RepID=UPI003D920CD5